MGACDFIPGLHFKTLIINKVSIFDARVLTLDTKSKRFLTSERSVIVDSFAEWRIGDVGLFYAMVGGDEYEANLRLERRKNRHRIRASLSFALGGDTS
jgi:membrane protease subunit HflC